MILISVLLLCVSLVLLFMGTPLESSLQPIAATPGKTIWLLWLQGWETAPPLAHDVAASWKSLNPDWNVELVSSSNLAKYVDIPYIHQVSTPQAKSDVIRLSLLERHGGVWADASMLCLMPIDLWVYEAVRPTGFWMYHGRDEGRGPASWFMVSMRNTIIIREWKRACDAYWTNRTHSKNYFWMDELFANLCRDDPTFRTEWSRVPYLYCEAPGQAHMLAGKVGSSDEDLKKILRHNPPYAVKLNLRVRMDPDSNGQEALKTAKYQRFAPYPLHKMVRRPRDIPDLGEKVLVVADCGNHDEIRELQAICNTRDIEMVVYDKCNFGKHVPDNVYCRPLENVGRDAGTFTHFVLDYWDNLPKDIYFLPGNINKHNRRGRFLRMLDQEGTGCGGVKLGGSANFTLSEYEGTPLLPASLRPFKAWYEAYVGKWKDTDEGPCWNCVMRTSRNRIRRHPKTFFLRIEEELKKHNNNEVVHYVERSMASIF
jgi:hypothetical protein